MSERSRTGLAIAAFGLLLVIVYADPLWTRRNFVGRDLIAYNLPMEKMIHDSYARGRLPVWSAEISGGRPLLPNPNAGALYPIRPLLSRVSFPLAMRLFPVVHWFLAAAGSILLLRSIGTSLAAAWIGAAAYAFSGVAVSEIFYPHHLPGMALLPWILWTVHRDSGTSSRRMVWLAALLALFFYAAEVFTILLAIVSAALWILLETERTDRSRRFRELGFSLALAALAAAPQIVASLLWVGQTGRAVLGMTLSEATLYSLSPARLLELVIPYLFGATWKLERWAIWGSAVFRGRPLGLFSTVYAGALAVLALVALARTPKRMVGLRFAKVLLALGVAASVLPSLLPERWASLRAPLAVRNPEKFAVSIVFSLSILSALAFDLYRRAARAPRRELVAGLGLAAVAVVVALAPAACGRLAATLAGDGSREAAVSAATELPFALTEAALLWILTVLALDWSRQPGKRGISAALLLLTFVPIAATRKIGQLVSEADAFAPTAFARMLLKRDPQGSFRTLGESLYFPFPAGAMEQGLGWPPSPARTWTEHTQALWSRGTVFNDDFDSGDFVRMESLRRLSASAAGFRDSGPFFGSLALRWGIRFRGEPPIAGYRRIGGDTTMDWDEQERSEQDIRLLADWKEEALGLDALRAMPRLSPGQIVIESGKPGDGHARLGSLRILEKTPERLAVEISAPDPTWLFVLREFWEFRRVELDGRPVSVFPAQIAFSAVAIPAGRHHLEWREIVPGGRASRWGPVLFLVIGAIAVGRGRSSRGKK